MQIFITDHDFAISAKQLDRRRLFSSIYEGIHVLSSNLGLNMELSNPKRSVEKHPVAKFWKYYELALYKCIQTYLNEWYRRGYKSEVNQSNLDFLHDYVLANCIDYINPNITDNYIKLHKRILFNKDPEYYAMWSTV